MRKNIGQKFVVAFALFVVMAFMSTNAVAAYNVKQTWARFSATAGETLATGQVVMLKDADGKAYKADANDAALRPAVGIVGKGAAPGAKVEIIVMGILSGWSSLSEGQPGYLSETAAAVTQTAPANSQQVGYAISATDYLFDFAGGMPKMAAYAPTLTPDATAAVIQTVEQTFTVTGLVTTDKVLVNGPMPTTLCPAVTYRVSAADTLAIGFSTLTAVACTPAAGTYNIVAIRY